MSFDWIDYYELALRLANQENDARLRSAISRAYYAVHNLARDYLIEVDYERNISTTGKAHDEVITKFHNHPNEELQIIGQILDDLRKDRGNADYRPVFRGLPRQTKKALKDAKQIIDLLNEHRP